MRKLKKRIVSTLLIVVWISFTWNVYAQEITIGADLVSNYVWRGSKLGNASFQPSVSAEYKGISLEAWGSTDFTGDAFELDLTAGYQINGLRLAITDYFATSDINTQPYFKYKSGNGHVFEGTIEYTFSEKIPLSLKWNTYFAGTDNTYKCHDYSTYIEAAYTFCLWKVNMSTEIGITPWKGAYADSFNVVNIGLQASKDITITKKFALPIFTKIIFNPADNRAFMVLGLSI